MKILCTKHMESCPQLATILNIAGAILEHKFARFSKSCNFLTASQLYFVQTFRMVVHRQDNVRYFSDKSSNLICAVVEISFKMRSKTAQEVYCCRNEQRDYNGSTPVWLRYMIIVMLHRNCPVMKSATLRWPQ